MTRMLLAALFALSFQIANAQVTCAPVFPTVDDDVTITFTATEGNGALAGVAPPIYAHMGVITDQSTSGTDWKHVQTTWGVADAKGLMTTVAPNVYQKTFNIRTFFGIGAGETVLKLAFVFRNQTGSIVGRAADGSDIFYDVYPTGGALLTKFVKPSVPTLLLQNGAQLPVQAAASQNANLTLFDNTQQVATATGKTLETTLGISQAGLHTVAFVAKTATDQDTSFFTYVVPSPVVSQDPPAGTEPGLKIIDNQTVRLSLYAPQKQVVYVIGDFNNWLPTPNYQMKRSLDGSTWWLDIGGITPGQNVRYQYFVDGSLKIADPYSTLVLDPWNDGFIPAFTYPDLPPYPAGKTSGIVSVFKTNEQPFDWQSTNYVRPKKTDLVVYELLLRDFIERHDYPTMLDTLDYLQKLGVTAIELMPINEFDGNINWGYSPAFHKAVDKYYGTKAALQTFVDECHRRGIAVIVDVVFNHATGASPLAQLYWDAANNRPAANNPWLNPTATHDFNVYNDFNHTSQATKTYVRNCLKYWLSEFRVDGFRFDLSKGFTQKVTVGNIGAWGTYDADRIAILKDYANTMWSVDPAAYVILEHFADNAEEKELADYGMMLWGNMHGAFKEVALGFSAAFNQNLGGLSYKQRGFAQPHLIGYMESHDEERIAYDCKTYGNPAAGHNIKTTPVAMARIEMLSNLFYTVPGPKMLWQFGEHGYDFSINWCANGTINNGCRTDPKPIRWDYLQDPHRRHLRDVTAALLHLRNTQDVFETTDFQIISNNSGKGRIVKLNSPATNLMALANVGVTTENTPTSFQHTGWWYEYFSGDSLNVTNPTATLSLKPGEYRLYLDKFVALPPGIDLTISAKEADGQLSELLVFPNPATDWLNVRFALETASAVRVELLDLSGRQVQVIDNEKLAAGEHHLQLSLTEQPAGLYFLKISAEKGGSLVRRVVR